MAEGINRRWIKKPKNKNGRKKKMTDEKKAEGKIGRWKKQSKNKNCRRKKRADEKNSRRIIMGEVEKCREKSDR